MCQHWPPCPSAQARDHTAARVVAAHSEQGWNLLFNGVVVFDDTVELFPDGQVRSDPGGGRAAAEGLCVIAPPPDGQITADTRLREAAKLWWVEVKESDDLSAQTKKSTSAR